MPLLVALAAAAALAPSLGFYLFSDSFCFVADSAHYFNGFSMTAGSYFFRPIFYLVGGIVAWLAGNSLLIWHAMGLLLHAVNSVVFFLLARRVTGSATAAFPRRCYSRFTAAGRRLWHGLRAGRTPLPQGLS